MISIVEQNYYSSLFLLSEKSVNNKRVNISWFIIFLSCLKEHYLADDENDNDNFRMTFNNHLWKSI